MRGVPLVPEHKRQRRFGPPRPSPLAIIRERGELGGDGVPLQRVYRVVAEVGVEQAVVVLVLAAGVGAAMNVHEAAVHPLQATDGVVPAPVDNWWHLEHNLDVVLGVKSNGSLVVVPHQTGDGTPLTPGWRCSSSFPSSAGRPVLMIATRPSCVVLKTRQPSLGMSPTYLGLRNRSVRPLAALVSFCVNSNGSDR